MAEKARVTLGNVTLAATSPVVWKFVTGVAPYTTTFVVHADDWANGLQKDVGKPLTLIVEDARGTRTTIKGVYILHTVASDSPNRVAFLVADRRWKWPYRLVARDYNVTRKTGNRTAKFDHVPVETRDTFDVYDYLSYSLDQGRTKWTARRAIEDVLAIIDPTAKPVFESFPVKEDASKSPDRQFTLQNVTIRDAGDIALARLLGYVPGADVYITADSGIALFDSADLSSGDHILDGIEPTTWAGERITLIDRKNVRPDKVIVHYQREVECVFEFSDDYSGTRADPARNSPFLENVIPTVDPETEVDIYDPQKGQTRTMTVPPGTWVPVDKWLAAMDADRPDGSLPWSFETLKWYWFVGRLEEVLGARGKDLDEDANVAARVEALKQHFRQTFRINRRYMERIRSLRAVRVALLDPVTGARAPASVWGQACVIPSDKGKLMASRKYGEDAKIFRNVDFLAPYVTTNSRLIDTAPGPARVNIIDEELGIFRIEWIASPYGTVDSFLPCHLVDQNGVVKVPVRDLSRQDSDPVAPGAIVDFGSNGICLRNTMEMKAILTIVPIAPNNTRQFHWVEIKAAEVAGLFAGDFRIRDGAGPTLEVWVPPGELTSRWGWADDDLAYETIQLVLGLNTDDLSNAGIGGDLPGFVHVNEDRHLHAHALSLAAELLTPFANAKQGSAATAVPRRFRLAGNVKSAMIRVGTAPSAKVDAVHEFAGERRGISRWATLPESARRLILGIVPQGQ